MSQSRPQRLSERNIQSLKRAKIEIINTFFFPYFLLYHLVDKSVAPANRIKENKTITPLRPRFTRPLHKQNNRFAVRERAFS